MLKKETRYVHDKHFEVLHSELEPQMRSILLDWLLEVCSSSTNFFFLCMMGKYLNIICFPCALMVYYLLPGAFLLLLSSTYLAVLGLSCGM